MSTMRRNWLALVCLIFWPAAFLAVVFVGLFVYRTLLYMVPGLCLGFIGWSKLLADVLRWGLV